MQFMHCFYCKINLVGTHQLFKHIDKNKLCTCKNKCYKFHYSKFDSSSNGFKKSDMPIAPFSYFFTTKCDFMVLGLKNP